MTERDTFGDVVEPITNAAYLIAFHDELIAGGIPENLVAELVIQGGRALLDQSSLAVKTSLVQR